MGKPAARITDFHECPMVTPGTPPIPHVGGPVIVGSPDVITGGMPQARVGDACICIGPTDVIVMGSSGVFVNGLPAARLGDPTAHGGMVMVGCPTILIGETKAGSEGGAGSAEPGEAQIAYADFAAQVQTLLRAAEHGAPFCEMCFQKDLAKLKGALRG